MTLSTNKELETERYILSTMPSLYVPLWKHDGAAVHSDDSGGQTCTITGAVTCAKGKIFDGGDDAFVVADGASIRNLATLTLISWIYPTGWGGADLGRITEKGNSVLIFNVDTVNDNVRGVRTYATTNAVSYSSANSIVLNNWYHIAMTMDSDKYIWIYVNGVLDTPVGTQTQGVDALSDDTGNLCIGNRASDSLRGFAGTIGEVRVYKERIFTPLKLSNDYMITKWRYK